MTEIPLIGEIITRLDSLGFNITSTIFLIIDLYILLFISSYIVNRLGYIAKRSAKTLLVFGITGLSLVISSSILLGFLGLLSWPNYLILHLLIYLIIPLISRDDKYTEMWSDVNIILKNSILVIISALINIFRKDSWQPEKRNCNILVIIISFLMLSYFVLCIFTYPAIDDSLTYRLTRIGYWLQEGNIYHYQTSIKRQLYIAYNTDLVMLWLTSFFNKGFPLVKLAQFLGGLLCCAAIYEFCRFLGFATLFRLSAVMFFLGIPNAAMQFFTSYTDLFTTGCLFASLVMLKYALRDRSLTYFILFGAGMGLAIGAKGTVFYWGIGLTFLFFSWKAIFQPKWKQIFKSMALALVLVFLLGGANYVQNTISFGNPFAPKEAIKRVHRDPISSRPYFAYMNSVAYLWQLFEPHSNLPLLRPMTDYIFIGLYDYLSSLEKPHFDDFKEKFKTQGTKLVTRTGIHSVQASFGVLIVIVAILGGIIGTIKFFTTRDQQSTLVSSMFLSIILFLVLFFALQAWTSHKYRYFVLFAPFLAVLAMYAVVKLHTKVRTILLFVLLASQTYMAVHLIVKAEKQGLNALLKPELSPLYIIYNRCNTYVQSLWSTPKNIALAQTDIKLAGYFRTGVNHRISIIPVSYLNQAKSVEAFLKKAGYDSLITDLSDLKIKLGNVRSFQMPVKRTTLACRLLEAGERANVVYTADWGAGVSPTGWTGPRYGFNIYNWDKEYLAIDLWNPTAMRRKVSIKTSIETKDIIMKPYVTRWSVPFRVDSRDAVSLRVRPPIRTGETDPRTNKPRLLGLIVSLPELFPPLNNTWAGLAGHPLVTIDYVLKGSVGVSPVLEATWSWTKEENNDDSFVRLGHGKRGGLKGCLWSEKKQDVTIRLNVTSLQPEKTGKRIIKLLIRNADGLNVQKRPLKHRRILNFSVRLSSGRNDFNVFTLKKPAATRKNTSVQMPAIARLNHMTIMAPER